MSQNLLVERLKYAKRELTALKTAHRRGLGLLRVYTATYSAQGTTQSPSTLAILRIKIDFGGIAYPLVTYFTHYDNFISTDASFQYVDNGYGAEFQCITFDYIGATYKIYIQSTSPISNISHRWISR